MAKRTDVEINRTQEKIMDYLRAELADGAKYVSYTKIGEEIRKPKAMARATVKYNVNRLIRLGLLNIEDGKLSLCKIEQK